MLHVLATVAPVFIIIAIGYVVAASGKIDRATLSRIAADVTGPCFVFTLLSRSSLDGDDALTLIGGAAWMVAATSALTLLWIRGRAREHRGLLLVVGYWNSGNLAMSCSRLAFGDDGTAAAALVFCTVLTLHATVGVATALMKRPAGAWRAPLFHAAWLGVAVAWSGVELPRLVAEPVRMLGEVTIPLLLLVLGIQLRYLRITDLGGAVLAVTLRMGGGLAAMLVFVHALDVGGVSRQVLLLNSVMPAAVINVAVAERYDVDPELVASATVLGTLIALIAIPAMLTWLTV